jgi:hypothetical protein
LQLDLLTFHGSPSGRECRNPEFSSINDPLLDVRFLHFSQLFPSGFATRGRQTEETHLSRLISFKISPFRRPSVIFVVAFTALVNSARHSPFPSSFWDLDRLIPPFSFTLFPRRVRPDVTRAMISFDLIRRFDRPFLRAREIAAYNASSCAVEIEAPFRLPSTRARR